MKNISLSIIIALFGMLFLNSCIDDDYAEPGIEVPAFEGQANKSIKEIKSIYTAQFPSTADYLKENEFVVIEDDLIIEGYVVSNDKYGNFYKNLVIQEAIDGSKEGINISIGETGLFTKYAVGQKVFIKCKGLVLGKYGGEVQLGGGKYYYKSREWRLSPVASPSIDKHVFKDEVPVEIQGNVKTIDELTDDNLFTLVTLQNVQFTTDADQTWANVDGDHNDKFPFKETTVEDADGNTMTVFTSDYSKFAHQYTPKGSGTITGVLSAHKGSYQFLISSLDDVDMEEARFGSGSTGGSNDIVDPNIPAVTNTIAEMQALYSGSVETITGNYVIEGTVISNQGESGNFYNQVYIQDATGGIQLRSYKSKFLDDLALGQKVVINASSMKIGAYKGVIQIGVDFNGGVGGLGDTDAKAKVFRNGPDNDLSANVIQISEVSDAAVSTLVRFDEVQFIDADTGKTLADKNGDFKYSENRTITDKNGNTIVIRTANTSTFADYTISDKSGSITGVLSKFDSTWQLYIRRTSDIELSATRF